MLISASVRAALVPDENPMHPDFTCIYLVGPKGGQSLTIEVAVEPVVHHNDPALPRAVLSTTHGHQPQTGRPRTAAASTPIRLVASRAWCSPSCARKPS